jgi:hypothetical protein
LFRGLARALLLLAQLGLVAPDGILLSLHPRLRRTGLLGFQDPRPVLRFRTPYCCLTFGELATRLIRVSFGWRRCWRWWIDGCDLRGRRGWRSGHRNGWDNRDGDVEATEHFRLLPATRCFHHVVSHPPERKADIEAGRCEMLHQRGRECTLGATAVLRDGFGTGGERDQRVAVHVHPAQSALGPRAEDAPPRRRHEPIAAAGVDNKHALLGPRNRREDVVERDRLVPDVIFALQPGIDRDEVVDALHGDAVAGEVHDGEIGTRRFDGEVADHTIEFPVSKILGLGHRITCVPEHRPHGVRVIRGGRKPGHVLIGRIADHERHPFGGGRRQRSNCEAAETPAQQR